MVRHASFSQQKLQVHSKVLELFLLGIFHVAFAHGSFSTEMRCPYYLMDSTSSMSEAIMRAMCGFLRKLFRWFEVLVKWHKEIRKS